MSTTARGQVSPRGGGVSRKITSATDRKRLRDRLTPNAGLPGSLVYTPVESWTTDEVWMYLMQVKNPWGHSNRDLMTLYAGASADNECPLVVDTSTPTCGNSRFGCWVCTMVEKNCVNCMDRPYP